LCTFTRGKYSPLVQKPTSVNLRRYSGNNLTRRLAFVLVQGGKKAAKEAEEEDALMAELGTSAAAAEADFDALLALGER